MHFFAYVLLCVLILHVSIADLDSEIEAVDLIPSINTDWKILDAQWVQIDPENTERQFVLAVFDSSNGKFKLFIYRKSAADGSYSRTTRLNVKLPGSPTFSEVEFHWSFGDFNNDRFLDVILSFQRKHNAMLGPELRLKTQDAGDIFWAAMDGTAKNISERECELDPVCRTSQQIPIPLREFYYLYDAGRPDHQVLKTIYEQLPLDQTYPYAFGAKILGMEGIGDDPGPPGPPGDSNPWVFSTQEPQNEPSEANNPVVNTTNQYSVADENTKLLMYNYHCCSVYLFQGMSGGELEEVADVESLGIGWASVIIGILWVDLDNDGLADLIICERKDGDIGSDGFTVFKNNGGHFRRVYHIDNSWELGSSIEFLTLDANLDGFIDVLVYPSASSVFFSPLLFINRFGETLYEEIGNYPLYNAESYVNLTRQNCSDICTRQDQCIFYAWTDPNDCLTSSTRRFIVEDLSYDYVVYERRFIEVWSDEKWLKPRISKENNHIFSAGDVNNDTIPDLYINDGYVYIGKGDGTFERDEAFDDEIHSGRGIIQDFNGDKMPDLTTCHERTLYLYTNNGTRFSLGFTFPIPSQYSNCSMFRLYWTLINNTYWKTLTYSGVRFARKIPFYKCDHLNKLVKHCANSKCNDKISCNSTTSCSSSCTGCNETSSLMFCPTHSECIGTCSSQCTEFPIMCSQNATCGPDKRTDPNWCFNQCFLQPKRNDWSSQCESCAADNPYFCRKYGQCTQKCGGQCDAPKPVANGTCDDICHSSHCCLQRNPSEYFCGVLGKCVHHCNGTCIDENDSYPREYVGTCTLECSSVKCCREEGKYFCPETSRCLGSNENCKEACPLFPRLDTDLSECVEACHTAECCEQLGLTYCPGKSCVQDCENCPHYPRKNETEHQCEEKCHTKECCDAEFGDDTHFFCPSLPGCVLGCNGKHEIANETCPDYPREDKNAKECFEPCHTLECCDKQHRLFCPNNASCIPYDENDENQGCRACEKFPRKDPFRPTCDVPCHSISCCGKNESFCVSSNSTTSWCVSNCLEYCPGNTKTQNDTISNKLECVYCDEQSCCLSNDKPHYCPGRGCVESCNKYCSEFPFTRDNLDCVSQWAWTYQWLRAASASILGSVVLMVIYICSVLYIACAKRGRCVKLDHKYRKRLNNSDIPIEVDHVTLITTLVSFVDAISELIYISKIMKHHYLVVYIWLGSVILSALLNVVYFLYWFTIFRWKSEIFQHWFAKNISGVCIILSSCVVNISNIRILKSNLFYPMKLFMEEHEVKIEMEPMFMNLVIWSPIVLLVESVPQLIAQLWLLEYATADTIDGLFTLSIVCTGYDIFCAVVMGAMYLPDLCFWCCGKEVPIRASRQRSVTKSKSGYIMKERILSADSLSSLHADSGSEISGTSTGTTISTFEQPKTHQEKLQDEVDLFHRTAEEYPLFEEAKRKARKRGKSAGSTDYRFGSSPSGSATVPFDRPTSKSAGSKISSIKKDFYTMF